MNDSKTPKISAHEGWFRSARIAALEREEAMAGTQQLRDANPYVRILTEDDFEESAESKGTQEQGSLEKEPFEP